MLDLYEQVNLPEDQASRINVLKGYHEKEVMIGFESGGKMHYMPGILNTVEDDENLFRLERGSDRSKGVRGTFSFVHQSKVKGLLGKIDPLSPERFLTPF